MMGKFVATLVLLCVCQQAFGDDLSKEKDAALQRINVLIKEFNDAYRKTCDVFHKRKSYLDSIKNRQQDVGDSLLELSLLEVTQTANGAKQNARLSADSPKVYDCIQVKKDATLQRLQKAFSEGYVKTLDDLLRKAYDRKQWFTDRYSDRYYDASGRIRATVDTARDEIKSTNNKAYLATVLANFERIATEATKDALSLEPSYKNNEINFDRTLQNGPAKAFRGLTRKIVDEFIDNVNRCYALV